MQTLPNEEDNWLLDLMNGPNPLCFRCGERNGKKCCVIYKSGKVKEKVLCDVCADIHVRQHGAEIEWHAPNTVSTPTNGGPSQADNLSTPAAIRG